MVKKATTAKSTLAETLAALRKKGNNFGFEEKPRKFYSTGNVAVDAATGGGLPVGKLIEIYGKSGSGKTTLALQTAAGLMAEGKTVVWLDYERAFDKPYAEALGIDTESDQFIYNKPRSIEHGINILNELINTGEVALVVIDSIARMTTETELNQEMGKVTVGDKAKALYKMCRIILNPMDDNDCTVIVLNHWLDFINIANPMAPPSKYSPGGNAVPYFSQLRLQCEQVTTTKSDVDNVLTKETESLKTGAEIKITVTKNRSAAPYKKVIVHNEFGTGFSQLRSALEIAVSYGLVTKTTWTKINSPKLVELLGAEQYHGFDKFEDAVTSNPEARAMLITLAHDVATGNWKEEVSEEEKKVFAEENSDTA